MLFKACFFSYTTEIKTLFSSNEETVLNAITTLMYLVTPESKAGMLIFMNTARQTLYLDIIFYC